MMPLTAPRLVGPSSQYFYPALKHKVKEGTGEACFKMVELP